MRATVANAKSSQRALLACLCELKTAIRINGNLNSWSRKCNSGNWMNCYFCPNCGVRIFHESAAQNSADTAIVSLKAGTLDTPIICEPIADIWTSSKHPMSVIDKSRLQFEKGPDDGQVLINAWTRSLTK